MQRRRFLKKALAGCLLAPRVPALAEAPVELSKDHIKAVHARRRIVMMQDAYGDGHGATPLGGDFASWLRYRFSYLDELETQIDAIWWDMAALAVYPNQGFPADVQARSDAWAAAGNDPLKALVDGTHGRGLEAFFNHRISEVELDGKTFHLKTENPDWVIPTWWPHGMWNLAAPGLQDFKLRNLRYLAESYDFDGLQIDFARHTPILPPGRQWELRGHVTGFIRRVRLMLLEVAKKRGRPFLLAVRVPKSVEGAKQDGFDLESWARERLVDIFTIGTRSLEVDVASYLAIARGRDIKVQPCWDDHHASDAYQWQPIEFLRGVYSNWWRQGADSVVTWNWSNATRKTCLKMGINPGPDSHDQGFQELGNPESMHLRDKIFALDRRGAFPWAEGFFNLNADARLPLRLKAGREPVRLDLRIEEPVGAASDRVASLKLRIVLFGAGMETNLRARFNGSALTPVLKDPDWKDYQIFSPRPQPNSGKAFRQRVDPDQKLLRIEYDLDPRGCRVGFNTTELALSSGGAGDGIKLEKVEVHLAYS
jgi:hypothetical protein